MRIRPRLLLIDENPQDRALAAAVLGRDLPGAELHEVGDPSAFMVALDGDPWDIIVTTFSTGWASGRFLLRTIRDEQPDAAIVVFSEQDDRQSAVAAMKAGADDFVVKSPAGYLRLVDAVGEVWAAPMLTEQAATRPARPSLDSSPALPGEEAEVESSSPGVAVASTDPDIVAPLGAEEEPVPLRTVEIAFDVMKSVLSDLLENPDQPADGDEAAIAVGVDSGASDRPAIDEVELLRRQRETLLDRVANLERSNADLNQFAYIASHELQAPLRMVAKYGELLRSDVSGQVGGPAEESLRFMLDGADHMQALINDLLAFSRVHNTEPQTGPCDTTELVQQACSTLQAQIDETGAEIEIEDLPTVTGDAGQLGMVFVNLLSNALKFRGEDRPQVKISAERIDTHWMLSVRDNGIGIDAADQERIFTIFGRLHPEREGTGIGLALAKRVIERHGGQIWVQSEPGQGTTFFVSLPAADSEEAEDHNVVPILSGPRRRLE